MLRVYPASKVKHAQKWLELQETNPYVFFHARWLKTAKNEENLGPESYPELWRMCEQDVRSADVLLAYVEDGEVLKGALVEVGIAIASGVKVFAVGFKEGSWMYHKGVERFDTLEQAMFQIKIGTPNGCWDAMEKGEMGWMG